MPSRRLGAVCSNALFGGALKTRFASPCPISEAYFPRAVPNWLEYRSKYHTTTAQLAEIANKAQPKLLILYHRGVGRASGDISDAQYLSEIQRTYRGRTVIGNDLDVY